VIKPGGWSNKWAANCKTLHVQATVQYACKCVGSLNKAKHRYQLVTEGMWEKINGQVVSA